MAFDRFFFRFGKNNKKKKTKKAYVTIGWFDFILRPSHSGSISAHIHTDADIAMDDGNQSTVLKTLEGYLTEILIYYHRIEIVIDSFQLGPMKIIEINW